MQFKAYMEHSYYGKVKGHKYTFSKTPRFQTPRSSCGTAFYQLPPLRTSQQASIGFGDKFSFEKVADKNPSPFHYNIDKNRLKGISFGSARQKVLSGSYIDSEQMKTPSPGKYQTIPVTNVTAYSFISKRKQDSFLTESNTPGPGRYNNNQDLDKFGKTINSKFTEMRNNVIGKADRFFRIKQSPGPGNYNPQELTVSSRYKSPPKSEFKSSARKTYIDQNISASSKVPGPQYIVP